jgi:glycosyltransferase involved in cell wall biosynthesis
MLWTFLKHVDRDRVDPAVVFLADGPFASEVCALGIETIVIPAGRLRDVRRAAHSVQRVRRVIESGCEAILNWTAKSHVYGGFAATLAGMSGQTIWWQHGIPDGHWLDRVATAIPARAIGCSSHSSARAQSRLRPQRPTFVVHPGIDVPRIRTHRNPRHEQCRQQRVIGIVGRLQPSKGQGRFVEAVAELRRRGHDVRGLVVGGNSHNLSPGYASTLRELAAKSGAASFVTFTGHVEEPAELMQTMDVLVNASQTEGFGIALLEAMALGVPVIASADGGPAEIIEPDRSGLLVESPSLPSLVDGLERLLGDSHFRRQVGEGGRARFHSRFSAEKMCRRLEAALEGVAAG